MRAPWVAGIWLARLVASFEIDACNPSTKSKNQGSLQSAPCLIKSFGNLATKLADTLYRSGYDLQIKTHEYNIIRF